MSKSAKVPQWSPVDDETNDMLALVGHPISLSVQTEWEIFMAAVRQVARRDHCTIRQNQVRPLIRGKVAPKRIGAFYSRACGKHEGPLLRWDGDFEVSDDHWGRNAGRPVRIYVWVGGTL